MGVIEAGRAAPFQELEDPHLTPRQKDVLRLMPRGLSNNEIAKMLGIGSNTVRMHKAEIFGFFLATNSMHAVLLALNQGKLTYEEMTDGWDKSALSKLTNRELEVLDEMTKNNGENNSKRDIIGNALFISPATVKSRLASIGRKTKMNKMQIGILYVDAKKANSLPPQENKSPKQKVVLTPREMEVLVLTAKGFSRKETADQLFISERTVASHRNAIYQVLGATNAISAFKIALERGILKLENPANNENASPPFGEVVVYQKRRE